VVHHVYTADFKPLAAFCVPIILLFFGLTSLLYNRGRALAKGKEQVRSLYAAERAMQGTIWYLLGIILGTSLYGVLMRFGVTFDPGAPSPVGLWLLLFLAPYALMQAGLLCLMRAVWVVAPNLLRRVGPLERRRRVEE
jgi:predicted lysophospholipase L1 biosynthesis ABC-type transport system permease subunit